MKQYTVELCEGNVYTVEGENHRDALLKALKSAGSARIPHNKNVWRVILADETWETSNLVFIITSYQIAMELLEEANMFNCAYFYVNTIQS